LTSYRDTNHCFDEARDGRETQLVEIHAFQAT
jgi:hypothetical protein